MRRDSNLLHGSLLLPAVMIISTSCGADREPAPPAALGDPLVQLAGSEDAPAQVILLTGTTADAILDGEWAISGGQAPPPGGRVLVAGGEEGVVFAFVLGRDLRDAQDQLEVLAVSGEVRGCVSNGVTCCDLDEKTWVLDSIFSEFRSERFWLRLRARCEPAPVQEGWTDDEPSMNEPGADFIEVKPEIWEALAGLGVTHPVMSLAAEDHESQVLVAPSWQSGALEPPVVLRLGLQTPIPVALAGHVNPPAPPPGGCASTISYCRSDINLKCNADRHASSTPHTARHHWYRKQSTTGNWCETVDRCNCP